MAALQALVKPQVKRAILDRPAHQPWPPDAGERVDAARALCSERLGYDPAIEFPPEGDYHLVARVAESDLPRAMAFAVVLSRALPDLWFVLDRLFVRDGQFFRRERRFKLNLVPAPSVHLPRAVRTAIRAK